MSASAAEDHADDVVRRREQHQEEQQDDADVLRVAQGSRTQRLAAHGLDAERQEVAAVECRYREEVDDAEVEALVEQRRTARAEKNWAESDRIRDELKAQGILVEDTPQGMKWKRV